MLNSASKRENFQCWLLVVHYLIGWINIGTIMYPVSNDYLPVWINIGIIIYPVSNDYLMVWINIGIIMYPESNDYLMVWINIGKTMHPVSNNSLKTDSVNWPNLEKNLKSPKAIQNISNNRAPL